MLRLVIFTTVVIMSWSQIGFAEDGQGAATSYREPTEAELQRFKLQSNDGLKQAENYYQSEAFRERLSVERAKAGKMPANTTVGKFELPPAVMDQKWADAFAKAETASTEEMNKPAKSNFGPIVFVSLSMPRDNLKQLAAEAVKVGGGVIFRGLKNDNFKEMRQELAGLGNGFAIDPTLFERFNVTEVPSFVLPLEPVTPCDINGCVPVKHVKVTGNVSLSAALDYISVNSHEAEAKDTAAAFLKGLIER